MFFFCSYCVLVCLFWSCCWTCCLVLAWCCLVFAWCCLFGVVCFGVPENEENLCSTLLFVTISSLLLSLCDANEPTACDTALIHSAISRVQCDLHCYMLLWASPWTLLCDLCRSRWHLTQADATTHKNCLTQLAKPCQYQSSLECENNIYW